MTNHANHSETVARLGTLALIGMAAFLFACVAAQFLRTDLDWMQVPNSFYLIGPYGWMVRAGYFAMSFALILFAAGGYLALHHTARSAAPLLLFVVGAMALSVTAIGRTAVDGQPLRLENYVHGVAAQTAFLCTVTAMLLQAWRLRGDARWRRWFRPAFLYAMACFVLLWVQALWRGLPRGASQKLLIMLILSGLMLATYQLRRGPDGAE